MVIKNKLKSWKRLFRETGTMVCNDAPHVFEKIFILIRKILNLKDILFLIQSYLWSTSPVLPDLLRIWLKYSLIASEILLNLTFQELSSFFSFTGSDL